MSMSYDVAMAALEAKGSEQARRAPVASSGRPMLRAMTMLSVHESAATTVDRCRR